MKRAGAVKKYARARETTCHAPDITSPTTFEMDIVFLWLEPFAVFRGILRLVPAMFVQHIGDRHKGLHQDRGTADKDVHIAVFVLVPDGVQFSGEVRAPERDGEQSGYAKGRADHIDLVLKALVPTHCQPRGGPQAKGH